MTRRRRNYAKTIITAGSVASALVAIAAAWLYFGMPTLAWSSDIRLLNHAQTEAAIDLYRKSVSDDTILRSQVKDNVTRALIDQRLQEAQQKLHDAQQRKIELQK